MGRVDTLLLEKFLLTIIPDAAKPLFSKAFDEFRTYKIPAMANGINGVQQFFHHEDVEVQVAAVNCLVAGIYMADVSQDEEGAAIFKGWLDSYAKFQGKNVVDFMQARAGRPLK